MASNGVWQPSFRDRRRGPCAHLPRLAASVCSPLLSSSAFAHNRKSYCRSWQFNVEVDDLRNWPIVPSKCETFVAAYVTGGRYHEDSAMAAEAAIAYAQEVGVKNMGKDIWIFDIDETSLSNVPYCAVHHFGSEAYNDDSFNEWVIEAKAPVLPATLKLYNKLKSLGFSIFFLTGRGEDQRNITATNLLKAGYSGWEGLILRQKEDKGVKAVAYKSGKRKALEDEGYHIVGNVGDQWSDISGYSVGERVFKLPNPMYFIS